MYLPFKTLKNNQNLAAGSEAKALAALQPAFERCVPADHCGTPLIYASPHSGSLYPSSWLKTCHIDPKTLRRSEDIYVDELFERAPEFGAAFLKARFARSFVDVNRSADDLPAMWRGDDRPTNARTAAGLGVIPMAIGQNQPIYDKTPPSMEAGLERLTQLYHPYHNALAELLEATKARHGYAMLIDCHSMPGFSSLRRRHPDFILGDRFARACGPALIDSVQSCLRSMGYSTARNYPYAGGYVTEHYGRPETGVQVLQIEINRDLYVNPISLRKKRGFEPLQKNMQKLMAHLADFSQIDTARAAE